MMPRLSGYEVCKHLRRIGTTTPVLMLTAKGLVDDRVTGLDSGADDYLVKPFSLRELLARIRALLRRFDHSEPLPETIQLGIATIDLPKRTITRSDEVYPLGEKEVGMLRLLIRAKGEPIDREKFLDAVWSDRAYPSTRTVDNFILALRKKIEADPANPQHILTLRGRGYRLQV
ncbi:UNVERIFIED_CONTAM: hypothetical protein GTU68_006655 [Idotea baltica]|nr:hypothetical protein [Idotea baltica]